MQNKNIPTNTDLPSKSKLIKSTFLAIFIAAIILVTIVLPAEYGIDPSGVGQFIGLKKMGDIKVSLAGELEAENAAPHQQKELEKSVSESSEETVPENVLEDVAVQLASSEPKMEVTAPEDVIPSDTMTLTLVPNQGKEIKLSMKKGARVNYIWYTDKGKANFDAHADSKELKIKYHNYSKGAEERSEGVLEAAFDGQHGWFWRNRTSEKMTVTLQVNGEYTDIGFVN